MSAHIDAARRRAGIDGLGRESTGEAQRAHVSSPSRTADSLQSLAVAPTETDSVLGCTKAIATHGALSTRRNRSVVTTEPKLSRHNKSVVAVDHFRSHRHDGLLISPPGLLLA